MTNQFQKCRNKQTERIIEILRIRNDGTVVLTNGDRISKEEFAQQWEIVNEK